MLGRYIAVKKENDVEGGFVRNISFNEENKSVAVAEIRILFEGASRWDCINLIDGFRPVNYNMIGIHYRNEEM